MKNVIFSFVTSLLPLLLHAKRMPYKTTVPNVKQRLVLYGYTGQEKELELKGTMQLLNYRARLYDARLKKFLSPDQLQEQCGAYTYVLNNPVNLVDPTGNKIEIIFHKDFPKDQQAIYKEKVMGLFKFIETNGNDHHKLIINTLLGSPDPYFIGIFKAESLLSNKYTNKKEVLDLFKVEGPMTDAYKGANGIVIFNPDFATAIRHFGVNKTQTFSTMPLSSTLLHESAHLYDYEFETIKYLERKYKEIVAQKWKNGEEKYVIKWIENPFNATLNQSGAIDGVKNLGQRTSHTLAGVFKYETIGINSVLPKINSNGTTRVILRNKLLTVRIEETYKGAYSFYVPGGKIRKLNLQFYDQLDDKIVLKSVFNTKPLTSS